MILDAIQEWILRVAKAPVARFGASKKETPEICIIELGGTDVPTSQIYFATMLIDDEQGNKRLGDGTSYITFIFKS